MGNNCCSDGNHSGAGRKMENPTKGKKQLFMIENPILDVSVEVQDPAIFEKYELQKGLAMLAGEKQMPIYDEIWNMEGRETFPGGSTLNSARGANWFLNKQGDQGSVTYLGSIGNDDKGKIMEDQTKACGVNGLFYKCEDGTNTGTCGVILHNKERTLVADLAASGKYPTQHLKDNMDSLNNAKLIYTSAFFITSNPEALMMVAKHASENDVPMGFNLSAVFLIQFELKNVMAALEHADYVFCNEDEAAAFGTSQNMEEGVALTEVAKKIAALPKANMKRPRNVIITYGAKPTIIATNDHSGEVTVQEVPITPIPAENVIDTNGAGDAFVGGFLSQLYQDKDIVTCVKAGNYLGGQVVQRGGCTFPDDFNFEI